MAHWFVEPVGTSVAARSWNVLYCCRTPHWIKQVALYCVEHGHAPSAVRNCSRQMETIVIHSLEDGRREKRASPAGLSMVRQIILLAFRKGLGQACKVSVSLEARAVNSVGRYLNIFFPHEKKGLGKHSGTSEIKKWFFSSPISFYGQGIYTLGWPRETLNLFGFSLEETYLRRDML